MTLWSRYEDGSRRVEVYPVGSGSGDAVGVESGEGGVSDLGGVTGRKRRSKVGWRYEVMDLNGSVRSYRTAKELLIYLTGHPNARNWTFDRYFGIGKHARDCESEGLTIFEILSPKNALDQSGKPIQLGIDLVNRRDEVAKLLFARFGNVIRGCGFDSDDILQEVYKGLLIRNKGTCAWDSRKSSFGHYVNMVAEGVMSNIFRKSNRRKEKEQIGAPGGGADDAFGGSVDASESMFAERAAITIADTQTDNDARVLEDLSRFLVASSSGGDSEIALKTLPLVQAGYGRSEIAEQLGVSKVVVSRALGVLRKVAKEWAS